MNPQPPTPLSNTEKLAYSTVRIESTDSSGGISNGTGFFFNFLLNPEKKTAIPVILTNKHVVNGAVKGRFVLTKADANGKALDDQHFPLDVSAFGQRWINHPDPDVDLCAFPIGALLTQLRSMGHLFAISYLDSSIILKASEEASLDAMEEILMVGYPNGIWDDVNNKPIFRRGVTATHPAKNYRGKKEFVIDAACFPGSSGSPVFIHNVGSYAMKTGSLAIGSRTKLLGLLYAGPQQDITGEIRIVDVPTAQMPMSMSRVMINLGFVIKAERIIELEEKFKNPTQ
ncbi:S1 family peptidase [Hymenobacter negativus]|uniref:Trypsin-like peptidase domain-containing protein n=1 Tax=Hymenobacter negativus TaxID=2795026 RepID=A0ABS0QBZ4_9BACT|nr:serine protease [Hymenobacter negativus]MBH8559863.1 trypsin-like peptidase domain-containing protein [Hymenobacter negativus]